MTAKDDTCSPLGLPHAGPSRFVTNVISHDAGSICCEGCIPAGSPYGRGGECPAFVMIELAAQAAAALESLERREGQARESPAGLLVRVWRTRLNRREVAEGRAYRTIVRRTGSARALVTYDMSVFDEGGDEILSGELGIYRSTV